MTHEEWLYGLKQTYDEYDRGMTKLHWTLISDKDAFNRYLLCESNWFLMELMMRA